MAAPGAVPAADTTLSIINRNLEAVSLLITRFEDCLSAGVYRPAASLIPAISVGVTRTPSFAIVAKIDVACIAVTE